MPNLSPSAPTTRTRLAVISSFKRVLSLLEAMLYPPQIYFYFLSAISVLNLTIKSAIDKPPKSSPFCERTAMV